MTVTTPTTQDEVARPAIQDIILALTRAERWEHEGDLRAAQQEITDSIKALEDEHNRIAQKRRSQ